MVLLAGSCRTDRSASASLPVMLAAGACWLRPTQFLDVPALHHRGRTLRRLHLVCPGKVKGIRICNFSAKFLSSPILRRRTEHLLQAGPRSLLLAKSFPARHRCSASPIFHMRARKFLLYDGLGSVDLGLSILGAGYIFSNRLNHRRTCRSSRRLAAVIIMEPSSLCRLKYAARQNSCVNSASANHSRRIENQDRCAEDLVIVDLRHSMDSNRPGEDPGAFRMDAKELEERTIAYPRS